MMERRIDIPPANRELESAREEFLCGRFNALSDSEQTLLMTRLLDQGMAAQTGAVVQAARLFRETDRQSRLDLFRQMLTRGSGLDEVSQSLLHSHKSYFPSLLAAINAAYAGEDIGLLTARGNRRAHQPLIEAIQDYIGFSIPRRNTYFVNDETRNGRLGRVSTAEKKLRILRDFAEGTYTDASGEKRQLSRQYSKVYFYDDEAKNLNAVSSFAAENGLSERLVAVNAKQVSAQALWENILQKIESGHQADLGRTNVIHFFDIDGTLIQVDARMYVIHRETGKRLLTITQEQLAERSPEYWLAKAKELSPASSVEELCIDFGDFTEDGKILNHVAAGRQGNSMFKRPASPAIGHDPLQAPAKECGPGSERH